MATILLGGKSLRAARGLRSCTSLVVVGQSSWRIAGRRKESRMLPPAAACTTNSNYSYNNQHHPTIQWFTTTANDNGSDSSISASGSASPPKRKKRFVPASEPEPRTPVPPPRPTTTTPSVTKRSITQQQHLGQTAAQQQYAVAPTRPTLRLFPRALEGLPISFVEPPNNNTNANAPARRRKIDCLGIYTTTIQGVDYIVGLPIDTPVTLCFDNVNKKDGGGSVGDMIPISVDDHKVMDPIFPILLEAVDIAKKQEQDDEMVRHANLMGQPLELKRTPLTLTLAGIKDENVDDDDEITNLRPDEPLEERPQEEHEEVGVLLQFTHKNQTYCLVKEQKPFFVVGKTKDVSQPTCLLLAPEEAAVIYPILNMADQEDISNEDLEAIEKELQEMKSAPLSGKGGDDTNNNNQQQQQYHQRTPEMEREMDRFFDQVQQNPGWAEELLKKAKKEMPNQPPPEQEK